VGAGRILPLNAAGLGLSLSDSGRTRSFPASEDAGASGGPGVGAGGIRHGASRSHGVL